MEFFQDPSELDYHIIPIIREYIKAETWDLVEKEIDKYIDMIKNKLFKMHKEKEFLNFDLLAGCESVSDVLHIRNHVKNVYGMESFNQCLISAYSIKETLLWGQPFEGNIDQLKKDFQKDVDRLQQYLKESILIISIPEIWATEKIKLGLDKGRKQSKDLESLYACIKNIGIELKQESIIRKIKTYTDDRPYHYKNFILKYDSQAEKIYQVDKKTGKQRDISIKRVYDYINRVKKNIK
ncbi:MAG: hypothetical protein K8S18_00905 [Desulfobacula sp.]|nr:hypothetical protein [Desulfobacula sp.]